MEINVPTTSVLIEDVKTPQNNALMTTHVPRICAMHLPENACSSQSAAHAPLVKSDPAIPSWDARSPKEFVTTTTHVPSTAAASKLDAHLFQMTNCAMTTIQTPSIDVISSWDVSELQSFVTITTHAPPTLQSTDNVNTSMHAKLQTNAQSHLAVL
jgi:hypothetical protein